MPYGYGSANRRGPSGPGPGGQGARGQATQNPGRSTPVTTAVAPPSILSRPPGKISKEVKEPPFIPEPIKPKIIKEIEKKIKPILEEGEQKQEDYFFNKETWEDLEKYKTIGDDFRFFPDRENRQTPFKSKGLLNKFLTNISLEYPDIKMTDEFGYVDDDKVKQVIDQAYLDGNISIGDNINITRTLDTTGKGITGIDVGSDLFNVTGFPEKDEYTIGSKYNIGDLGLSYTGDLLENDLIKQKLGFNYDDETLTGEITKDYINDYTLSKLDLDKTFDLNDIAKLNLQGEISNLRYDGENYIDSSLTPRLGVNVPVGSGILQSSIGKNIMEGGTPDLGIDFSYPFAGGEFQAGASDILSENPNALLGYSYTKGDPYSTDPYLGFNLNWDPIEGEKSAFFGLKKKFNKGGRVGLYKGGNADQQEDPDQPGANFNQLLELSLNLENARTFAGTVADASTEMEQSPDSFLRPGETLEDWDVSFRKPSATGGIYGEYAQQIADGGRVGYKDGRTVGNIIDARNIPYYAGKGLQGLVNSAETLSKFPLAAGELGSKLIRQKPSKKMFMEAIENITPGSWSEKAGLTPLLEGMAEKRSPEAKAVGNVLGLGTEIAVPTGGAFKAGQILLSKASKVMGKVKDGKTLEKLIDQKLTDAGQSRRDFNVMVGTSGLMVALKSIGLGGILKTTAKLKPPDDVVIRLRTFIDDSDVMTDAGPVAQGQWGGVFDVESLSKAAAKTMEKLMFPGIKGNPRDRIGWSKHRSGHNEGIFNDIPTDEGSYIADALTKAGHKVKFEHVDDMGGIGGVDDVLDKFKNSPLYKGTTRGKEHYKKFSEKVKKMTERDKIEYHNSITDDYGYHHSEDVKDVLDILMPVKKAQGGRIYGEYAQQLASGGRVGYDEGDVVLPQKKPWVPPDFKGGKPPPKNLWFLKKLLSQEARNTLGARTWTDLTFDYAKKAHEAGQISDETYKNLIMPLFGEKGEQLTEAIAKHDELNKGGRVGLVTGSGDYAKKYLKHGDKPTQDKFNRLVNDLRTNMSLESAISEALREIRAGSN